MESIFAAPLIDWHPVVAYLLQALTPLVLAAIVALFAKLTQKIHESTASDRTKAALDRLAGFAQLAVTEVAQTSIDAARKTAGEGNSLPKDVANAALDLAKARVLSFMSQGDMSWLTKTFGLDTPEKLQAFVTSHVESAVAEQKKA